MNSILDCHGRVIKEVIEYSEVVKDLIALA